MAAKITRFKSQAMWCSVVIDTIAAYTGAGGMAALRYFASMDSLLNTIADSLPPGCFPTEFFRCLI